MSPIENKITFEAAYACRITHTDLLGNERLYLLLAAGETPTKLLIAELESDFVEVEAGVLRSEGFGKLLLDASTLVKSGGLPQAVADTWLQITRKDLTDLAGQMQSVIGSNEYTDADKNEAADLLVIVEDALALTDLTEYKSRYQTIGPIYTQFVIELRKRGADRAKQAMFERSLAILNGRTEGATEADRKTLHEMCGVPYTEPTPTPEPVVNPAESENPINPLNGCTKVEAEFDAETNNVIHYNFSGGGKAEPCPIAKFEGEGGGLGHVD